MDSQYLPVADAIESLITTEIRRPGLRGIVRPLAATAREKQGGPPVLLAAERLVDSVHRGDIVVIATGFPVPGFMPAGEDDGPPGAAAPAYAVSHAFGAVPLVLAEEQCLAPVRASLDAIGLLERPLSVAREVPSSFVLQSFPDDDRAEARADEVARTLVPKAIVTIEKLGLNAKGVAHRGGGQAQMEGHMRIEALPGRAREAGILTIAIGDAGNEAGMGLVAEATRQYHKWGAVYQCPCQGGVAATEAPDVTVVAQVSNWGAYGIAAMLGVLLGNERTLHEAEAERRVLEACQRAGAVDGFGMGPVYYCDDIPGRIHCHIVDILQLLTRTALNRAT
ncbi:MAG: DUF4392 domain-containing protein [Chloroflexi bacterium]|nr:DUF4392 domain-containing protein [Bacteroidota bacterium]MCL5111099.1 DUF4392 domain-containing protein [Chloroflexota bacterium]